MISSLCLCSDHINVPLDADDPSLERLQRKLESTIASVRASAASEGVRILLAQDKYRSMVQKAVEDNWKFLKNDIKGSIKSQNVVQVASNASLIGASSLHANARLDTSSVG